MIDSHNHSRSTDLLHVTQSPDVLEDQTRPFYDKLHTDRGTILSAMEIQGDLTKLFHYLNVNLAQYEEGSSPFLKTHVDALRYAERIATYAVYDYPRHVEGEPQITTLWEALHRIRRLISAWRTGEYSGDGQTELTIIKQLIQNTLREMTPPDALT